MGSRIVFILTQDGIPVAAGHDKATMQKTKSDLMATEKHGEVVLYEGVSDCKLAGMAEVSE